MRFLEARHVHAIELVVISHLHPDHLLGLGPVVRAMPVIELWLVRPPDEGDDVAAPFDATMAAVLEEGDAHGTRIVNPPLGLARDEAGVRLTVLAPTYEGPLAAVDPVRSVNDNSLVIAIERVGRRFLFTGDIEREGEDILVAAAAQGLGADVVKVPHHGSPTSSAASFVAAVAPRFAVISCGLGNRFGFPSARVVERWQAAGATVLRTDERGAVTVVVDAGGRIGVSVFSQR